MNKDELKKLIQIGEGFTVEFKRSPSHLGREICAFANAAGGTILIGVDDNSEKIGITDVNRLKSQVQTFARNIDPPLVLDIDMVDNVLVVTVPSGPNKPYSANGLFYIREAANSQQMKRDEIREFFFKEGLIRFDEQPCRRFDLRRDFDIKKYQAFIRSADIPRGLKREDVLKNLQVITEGGMTNAGVLLFSKKVPKFFLQASMICALFQGTTKTKVLDQATFRGDIAENYNDAISYLMSHLNTEYVIKAGPREEILELPEEALREAILNAIAHRDYRSTTTIQVHIFQDRLEIINPGGLVSGLKLKDLGRVSRPRNLLLFSLMARMDLVEQIGSGIKRIREAVRTYGLKPPLIEADAEWFSIIFWRKTQHDAIEKSRRKETLVTPSHEGLSEGVNEGVARLMEFVRKNPGFRTPQISKEIDVPIKTLERWLKQLRNEGKIEFRGSPKTGGYWETA
jgi:ATP-dependent DNA helicase RecG